MKEKIYTIPVTEAFQEDCECPICNLEKKLESEYIEYTLGPSLMEPDGRIETNEKGFCKNHFEMLFNRQENKLGLGLIIDTHLKKQIEILKNLFEKSIPNIDKNLNTNIMQNISKKITSKQTDGDKSIGKFINSLETLEKKCAICDKLDNTIKRYVEVIIYLWSKEPDFKKIFKSKKGFCLRHFKSLLVSAQKELNLKESAQFSKELIEMELSNLDRIQDEVHWFTKKFDYKNQNEPWKNSKDSLNRSIQKIVSYCYLK
ncbi:MAG: DUF6062 family protein [Clostridiales bacterium]